MEHPCRGAGLDCPTLEVVDGFWYWRYVQNPGAAWGVLRDAPENLRVPFFFFVSVAAIVFILAFFRKLEDQQHLTIVALSLVFGGAIGNFIDRIHLSYVIDFIDWYIGTYHWPTFNIADSAISCGVVLLMIEWIRDAVRGGSKADAPSTEKVS
ncbi:MAG: signal peptidase II [Myxococcales bacterium]|nr:signal peptidase II [Myxococcales bacterium]